MTLAIAAVRAQPPLTPTPRAAPGYTEVVMNSPVKAIQIGPWSVKATQEGEWRLKLADLPLPTIVDRTPPGFIRPQRSYVLSWIGGAQALKCLVTEVRPDGWFRASLDDGGGVRRTLWINSVQLATVEELP
jgi:hypothetical protein